MNSGGENFGGISEFFYLQIQSRVLGFLEDFFLCGEKQDFSYDTKIDAGWKGKN